MRGESGSEPGHQGGMEVRQRIAILETVTVFVLIMVYIWSLRYRYHSSWLVILAFMLVSHFLHDEGAESIGFRTRNFRE